MAGRNRVAAPGEPECGVHGCPRPAGFATAHPGEGPCLRHGGDRWVKARRRRPEPKEPPGWRTAGEAAPYATLLRRLAAAKRSGWPFPLAWADALYDALDGLPAAEFGEWAGVLLETGWGWRDAYEGRAARIAELAPDPN
jgi:hypothetical protein